MQAIYPLTRGGQRLVFSLFPGDEPRGIEALNPILDINGQSLEPTARYYGGDSDSTWSPWSYGEDLTLQAGSPSYNVDTPLFGSKDKAVKGDGTAYWQAGNSDFGQIDGEDFIFEFIVKIPADLSVGKMIFSKLNGITDGGYQCWVNSSYLQFQMFDVGGSNTISLAWNGNHAGEWAHILVMADNDETDSSYGVHMYINGKQVSTTQMSALGSTANSLKLALMARPNGSSSFIGGCISYWSFWKKSNWFPGGASNDTIMDAIAEERFLRLVGLWPRVAKGSKAPTSWGRAFSAYLEKDVSGVKKLFQVGENWLRVEDDGYLAEPQITQYCQDPNDLTAASWSLENGTDSISANAITARDEDDSMDGIVADTTDTQHGATFQHTSDASTRRVFAADLKAGNKTWAVLENKTLTAGKAYFDLTNGTVGTTGADITEAHIIDKGNGIYRAWIKFNTVSSTTYDLAIRPAEDDGDDTFAGDGSTVNLYVWGVQVEKYDHPTSPIRTSGATVTRLRDDLEFDGSDGNVNKDEGTVAADIVIPENNGTGAPGLFAISDGNLSNNSIYVRRSSTKFLQTYGASGGSSTISLTGTVNISDGSSHAIRVTWKTDDVRQYTDGGDEKQDTSATMPVTITKIGIGQYYSGANGFGGRIKNVRIYGRPTKKG